MTRSPDPGLALLDAIADRIGGAVEKHRVEAKLRHSEEYFQTVAERLIVVSDIVMPGIGGGELIDRLRALRPNLAVVLISGYSHDEAMAGVHRKASAFLPKPFSPEEITRVIRETLER